MAEEWMRLFGAFVRDVQAMREYEAKISLQGKRHELTRAWNILSRSDAYNRAVRQHSVLKYRLFLQAEISRPVPPKGFENDPETWEVVKADMKRQLDMLGGPVSRMGVP